MPHKYVVIELKNDRERRTNATIGETITRVLPPDYVRDGTLVGEIDDAIRWLQARRKDEKQISPFATRQT